MSNSVTPVLGSCAKRPRALALVILAVVGLAGCTQPVKVSGTPSTAVAGKQTFRKLLVVGLSPDYNQRCSFEWALTPHLRDGGAEATSSCSNMKADELLSPESIKRVVATLGVDGVLVSRLVASSGKVKEGGTRDTRGAGQYKAIGTGYETGYWGGYGMPVIYAEFQNTPSIFSIERTAVLTTQLYETSGATLVYSLETKVKGRGSRGEALSEISPAIAGRLRKAGLIP